VSAELNEAFARRRAVRAVQEGRNKIARQLPDIYALASSYASELEGLIAHMEETVRILNGEPVD
jgi:hypothetical protein